MARARKPGKYDAVLPKLKKLPPQDLPYQERVDDAKKELRWCTACSGEGKMWNAKTIGGMMFCPRCEGTGRRALNGNELAKIYTELRAEKESVEAQLSAANLQLEAVSQMLVASQENKDADWGAFGGSDRSIKLTNGDSVRVQPEVFALARDKSRFREWCYAQGLRDKMELPEKPTQDLSKQRLLVGAPEAPGIEVYVRTRIVFTPFKTGEPESEHDTDDTTQQDSIF